MINIKDYYKKSLAQTSNYMQRFLAFLVFTQLNFFLWYLVFSILMNTISVISFIPLLIGAGIQVFLIFTFLFQGIKARSATYIASGAAYLAISALIYYSLGSVGFWDLMMFIVFGLWNAACGVIILLIGLARIFMLGVKKDYEVNK